MDEKSATQRKLFLILTTLIVGMCSIVYELLVSTAASYFLGNSVKQFSLIIGFYMAAMGVGSYLSSFIQKDLLYRFVQTELLLGLVGAFSVPLIYIYFAYADLAGFQLFALLLISVIGLLTGLEVPLLTRILEKDFELKDNIANILAFDYLGALVATLIFPFFLIPFMGIYKSSLIFGMINICVGFATFIYFYRELSLPSLKRNLVYLSFASSIAVVLLCLFLASQFLSGWNRKIFKKPVIHHEETPYQSIVLTRGAKDTRLYLNGGIQFSSKDEYRYHEALVHYALMQLDNPKKVLVLGGGEGLAVREILKYESVRQVEVVDIDPRITELSSTVASITEVNQGSLLDPRVRIINQDAFRFLTDTQDFYDAIICDLPDPTNETLSRFYSNAFYKLLDRHLNRGGIIATQATSPDMVPRAFWCINASIKAGGFEYSYPYHAYVPSFGNWGFIMASHHPLDIQFKDDIETKYLSAEQMQHAFFFSKDSYLPHTLPNQLDQPILLDYYLDHLGILYTDQGH